MPKTVFITGVAGFIGRYVARHFIEQNWSVIGIDSAPPENAPLSSLSAYYRTKLPDQALNGYLQDHSPQGCIHCAGRASVGLSVSNPADDFYASTVVTFEMLNALRGFAPTCRFAFISSAAVYGNPSSLPIFETHKSDPLSPYGFHKWQGELLCREFTKVYGLPTAILRIFSGYGPGLRRQVIWDICYKAITHDSIRLQGTGNESRDFIHASDIASALMTVLNSADMQGEAYNLGSGREITIAELAKMVIEALNYNKTLEFDGLVPEGTPLNWCADISKLKQLGFSVSVPLEHGIKTFANWCQAELLGI